MGNVFSSGSNDPFHHSRCQPVDPYTPTATIMTLASSMIPRLGDQSPFQMLVVCQPLLRELVTTYLRPKYMCTWDLFTHQVIDHYLYIKYLHWDNLRQPPSIQPFDPIPILMDEFLVKWAQHLILLEHNHIPMIAQYQIGFDTPREWDLSSGQVVTGAIHAPTVDPSDLVIYTDE